MPVIRVSKMGKCIQKLREERGMELRRTGRTYPAVTRGIKMHGKWYKRTRQDDRHFAWLYPKRACRQPVKW